MSLYSGPAVRSNLNNISPTRTLSGSTEIVLLSTGDSNLAVAKRRATLHQHYRGVRDLIGILVLPHHGAFGSFHHDLLLALPNLSIGIAAAGPNPYGHPDLRVQSAVKACCEYHQVTDATPSRLAVAATI
jgi:hypothetical protein